MEGFDKHTGETFEQGTQEPSLFDSESNNISNTKKIITDLDKKYSVVAGSVLDHGKEENSQIEQSRIVLRPKKERVKRKQYSLEDYIKEFQEHPEWYGKSTHEAQKEGKESGLHAFYKSIFKFAKKVSNDDETKYREIMDSFFPEKLTYRESYTLEGYKKEWQEHPEWHGKTTSEAAKKGKESGLSSFYESVRFFAKKESKGDKIKYRKIMDLFFLEKRVSREGNTLEDYKKEWQEHLEWHGKSTGIAQKEFGENSLNAFYLAVRRFATRESNGDEEKYREIMDLFFPEIHVDREGYTLEDYKKEWQEHPEWHGKTTSEANSKEGRESGLGSFCESVRKFAKKASNDDETKYREIMDNFFPERASMLYSNRGFIFQYSIESVLKIIGNSKVLVEQPIRLEGRKSNHYPDLIYEYEGGKKVMIIDSKLQTTTNGIEKDTKNYTKYINEVYPEGGNLIFLCLNGPDFPNETMEPNPDSPIHIRYYHIIPFLKRLVDSERNKFLLRLFSGKEDDDIAEIPKLSREQIDKVQEIIERLEVLKHLTSSRKISTREISLDEAADKSSKMKSRLKALAQKGDVEKIMNTDFKSLMDF